MRVLRRLISAVLAIVAVAVGVFAIAQAVPGIQGRAEPVWLNYNAAVDHLANRVMSDPLVLAISGGVLLIGIVLLVIALRTGSRALQLTPVGEQVEVVMPARHVVRVAQEAAAEAEDVSAVTATARRHRIRVIATTHGRDDADLAARMRDLVQRRLDGLAPKRRPWRVTVRLRHGDGRPVTASHDVGAETM